MRKVLFFTAIFSLIGAISLVSCKQENFDTETDVDYTEVFLQTFEEKLSLVFHTAEIGLRNDNQQGFESLFRDAYVEALGEYAFMEAFDSGLWEVNPENRAMRTRSAEEADAEALLLTVLAVSETIEEAIEQFNALASDVSFSVENRVNFISMREFLIFLERNENEIIANIEGNEDFAPALRASNAESIQSIVRCVAGTYGSYLGGALGGCVGGGGLGFLFGGIIGAGVGCAVGGIMGGISGILVGAATFC